MIDKKFKRLFDLVGALLGLVLLFPFFILASLLIKLDSHGPVFYSQKRCGKAGGEFGMLKFRSMVNNADELKADLQNEADGSVFKVKEDPRVTSIGSFLRRYSLDEFPQLFNVLKGEMSLVGPRPLARSEMKGDLKWQELRLTVTPGMTGLWQIKGRDNESFNDWIRYDTEYVLNRSLWLDLKILFLTLGAVLKGRGAC
ncbi:sugar transferase [bacterium]|nr:sugar transferase [bacterium]